MNTQERRIFSPFPEIIIPLLNLPSDAEFRKRQLESGPAKDAGLISIKFVSEKRNILIFFGSSELKDTGTVISDLIAHTSSAGIDESYLILPSGESGEPKEGNIFLSGEDYQRTTDFHIRLPGFSIIPIRRETGIDPAISEYLNTVCHEIKGGIFHSEGEIPDRQRDLTILLLLSETLLKKQIISQGYHPEDFPASTLFGSLIWWVSSTRSKSEFDLPAACLNRVSRRSIIDRALEIDIPDRIRLSWLSPELWARGLTTLIHKIKTIPRKKGSPVHLPLDVSLYEPVIKSLIPILIPKLIQESLFFPGAGTGELPFHLLHLSLTIRTRDDHIIGRLIHTAEIVLLSDRSPLNTIASRFLIAETIIDGAFDDPALKNYALWWPLMILDSRITTGSSIYGDDVKDEFISVRAAYQILSRLQPLGIEKMLLKEEKPVILISVPSYEPSEAEGETGKYLTRKFSSYSPGTLSSTLIAEAATPVRQIETTIIITPSSWLSECIYSTFRRWVKDSPLETLIVPDMELQGSPIQLSALIFGKKMKDTIRVICAGSELSKEFIIDRNSLPGEDGWKFEDPRIKTSLEKAFKTGIPLSEYVLDAIHTPADARKQESRCWISISTEDHFTIQCGEKIGTDAIMAIPGPDPYLEAVLQSEVLTWIWQNLTSDKTPIISKYQLIKSLPVPPVDWYNPEQAIPANKIENLSHKRERLREKLLFCSTFHDKTRIQRRINEISYEIDRYICSLYGIDPLNITNTGQH